MSFWNNPENNALKVIVLAALVIVGGAFIYSHFVNPLGGRASLLGYGYGYTPCKPSPSVTVVSPNGGETFIAGQAITVKWKTCGIKSPYVGVSLVWPSGWTSSAFGTLGSTVPNTGSATFTLPNSTLFGPLLYGNYYKMRVVDTAGPTQDISDNFFSIVAGGTTSATVKVTTDNATPQTPFGSAGKVKFDGTILPTIGGLAIERGFTYSSGTFVDGCTSSTGFSLTTGMSCATNSFIKQSGSFAPGTFSLYAPSSGTGITGTAASLSCGKTYKYQAFAVTPPVHSSPGYSFGLVKSFSTPACTIIVVTPPSITTVHGYATGPYGAALHGKLNTLGSAPATLGFIYGLSTIGSISTTPVTTPIVPATATTAPVSFSTNLTGLTCGTNYKFAATGTTPGGSMGLATGALASFKTMTCPPAVSTKSPATGITSTSATISGTLTSLGGLASTNVGFDYGLSATGTTAVSYGSMSATGMFSKTLTGLMSNKTYYYRAWAQDPAYPTGSTYPYARMNGAWGTFKTP